MSNNWMVGFTVIGLLSCSNIGEQKSSGDQVVGIVDGHYFKNVITPELLQQHLFVVASDSFMGRGTGQIGIELAADYLSSYYRDLGIAGMGDEDGYNQQFNLVSQSNTGLDITVFSPAGTDSTILFNGSFKSGVPSDFYPEFSGTINSGGEIVFAGFGIEDSELKINHFDGVEIAGKWVVIFSEIAPPSESSKNLRANNSVTNRLNDIINTREAAGVLLIPVLDAQEFEEVSAVTGSLYRSRTPLQLEYLASPLQEGRPVLNISPVLASSILGLGDEENNLAEYYYLIAQNPAQFSGEVLNTHIRVNSNVVTQTVPTSNIVSYIEGSDPDLKEEYVVLSAHYDHMGIGQPDPSGDNIYNGADDNGSGTVALMAIAKALKEAKDEGFGPKRSVIFLHVSAEEIGLLGSRFYSDFPTVPIENIIANLNIDMIGRIDIDNERRGDSNYVYIIGAEIISSDLDSLIKRSNMLTGNRLRMDMRYNDLNDRNQFYRRSDHWNFGRLGIPFVFFFTGVHADYHRPSDTPDKILYNKYTNITQLIYSATIELANTDTPPRVDNEEFIRITRRIPR